MKNIKGQSATARMLDFIALIIFGITAPVTADTTDDIEAGAIMGNKCALLPAVNIVAGSLFGVPVK